MGYLVIYLVAFIVFFVYTGYWVLCRKEIQRFFWKVFSVLALKNVYTLLMIANCLAKTEILVGLSLLLHLLYVSTLFNFFINISLGVLFRPQRQKLAKTLLLIPLNVTLVLYHYYNFDTFGPFLVVAEGLVFLFIVKKTLNIIGLLYSYLHMSPVLELYLEFHSVFLSLIYLYFVEDLAKICTLSLFTRFQVEPASVLWEVLTALDQFLSTLSTLLIFQQIRALPAEDHIQGRIPFFQAGLSNTLTQNLTHIFLIDTCTLIIANPYSE